jgi:hypothetical protein
MTAGYSGTPLAKKLGIKPGFRVRLLNQPDYYLALFTDLPENISILPDKKGKKNFIHYFPRTAGELQKRLPLLKNEIESNGIIWISWPKMASNLPTDLTGNIVRNLGLAAGLVDIKVCAVNETWSGLKFVIPVKDRK